MSERLDGGHTETRHDPEVTRLRDFLETYDKIQAVLGWPVESSASAPLLKAAKRAQLQRLMQQLGVDTTNPDDPGGYKQLADLKAVMADRSQRPQPRVEIPGTSFFAQRIEAVTADFQRFGAPYNPGQPYTDRVSLLDVIQHGHTDWSEVQSRTGHLPTEIRGIASVMADPVAYHSWAHEAQGRPADHITIGEDWSIQNGRHRSLAAVCLGEDFIRESGMNQWIRVEVEPNM
jgi:hypothetical protein